MSPFFVPSLTHMKIYNIWYKFYSVQYQSGHVSNTDIFIYISPACQQFYLPANWNATAISTWPIKGSAISYTNHNSSSCIPTFTHQSLFLKYIQIQYSLSLLYRCGDYYAASQCPEHWSLLKYSLAGGWVYLSCGQELTRLTFLLFVPCTVNDYNVLVPTNAHMVLLYIAPYLAATCFSWSPSSGSSKPSNLNLTAIN